MDLKFPLRFKDKSPRKCPPHHHTDCGCCGAKTEEFNMPPCQSVKEVSVEDVELKCEGRLLKVKVRLDKVCAGRKVALGVLLYEKDCQKDILKGFKSCEIEIPWSISSCKKNITAKEFCFVLPEEDLCRTRKLQLKVIAHYSSFPGHCGCPN